MSQPSGSRAVRCPYCGQSYRLTNWMKRRGSETGPDGKRLSNTHLIACAKKALTKGGDR